MVEEVRSLEDNSFAMEVVQRLTRIETKLDSYSDVKEQVDGNTTDIEVVKSNVGDHERRIGNIEGWGKWLVAAVGMLMIGSLWGLVVR